MEHYDFVGNPIKEGDIVICLQHGRSNSWMTYGVTTSFTPECVYVINTWEGFPDDRTRAKCVKAYDVYTREVARTSKKVPWIISDGVQFDVRRMSKRSVVKWIGPGAISDGYHTFSELYAHRAALFSVVVNSNPEISWKSKQHHDGTMFDGMFIVGMDTEFGQITYHYNIERDWDLFKVKELAKAPEWDGHTPSDVVKRLISFGVDKRTEKYIEEL